VSRIPLPQPETATGELKSSFDAVRARYGVVPNGVRSIGTSPEALQGFLGFAGTLAAGLLTAQERERVALLTAQHNECQYCLSAHTLGGRAAGLAEAEIRASRAGKASDPRPAAILRFAGAVLERRGDVPDDELAAARDGGLADSELVEVVAEIALNTFTNYVNRLVRPELDIPQVSLEHELTA
jgi:uncharacterized peroxidase-related enzyme